MFTLIRTDYKHPDFVSLVSHLNSYLKTIDGDEHQFYMQFNTINVLSNVVVAYHDSIPVGCGAFKVFNDKSVEIKRMFTLSEFKRKKVGTQILSELEAWALELGYTSCVLETGKRQVEAVKFYSKNNYNTIANFGPYKEVDNSVCFEKELNYEKG